MNLVSIWPPILAVSAALDYLLLGAALVIVTGGILYWAIAIRKPPGKPRYKYHRSSSETPPPPPKRKRKRRSEPPRNPTLAETRGLPPVRRGDSNSDQDYQY